MDIHKECAVYVYVSVFDVNIYRRCARESQPGKISVVTYIYPFYNVAPDLIRIIFKLVYKHL